MPSLRIAVRMKCVLALFLGVYPMLLVSSSAMPTLSTQVLPIQQQEMSKVQSSQLRALRQVPAGSLGQVTMGNAASASSQIDTENIIVPDSLQGTPSPLLSSSTTTNGIIGIVGGILAGAGFIGFCIVVIAYSRFKGNPSLCESAISPVVVQTPFDDGLNVSVTRIESHPCSSLPSPQTIEAHRQSASHEKNRSSMCGRSSLSGIAIRVPSLLDHPPETFEMRLSIYQMRTSEATLKSTDIPKEMTF